MPIWTNSDGLMVRLGLSEVDLARAGSPAQSGIYKTIVADIVGTKMTSASALIEGVPGVILPAGAIVQSAKFITEVIFTGSSSTLNIGLAKAVDNSTYDADGIDATIALTAIDAVGETVTCDGALVGVALAYNSVLVADYDTAAFTAGRGKLVIELLIPDASSHA